MVTSKMEELQILLQKVISNSQDLSDVVEIFLNYNQENIEFEILKFPRWSDDAIIVKTSYNHNEFTLKIHYDKYPLACHMYNSPELLEILRQCKYISHIENTYAICNKNGQTIRCVIYPFIKGETLEKRLQKSEENDMPYLRELLKKCTVELFKIGVNPFIRDLADFIVTKDDDDNEIVVLTDYNALMDCHNATQESRNEIMSIMDTVIEKIVDKQYKPFVSIRPTLTDL